MLCCSCVNGHGNDFIMIIRLLTMDVLMMYHETYVQNLRLCSCPHSHKSVIFSYFWRSSFLSYGNFVEYMNMHAASCLTTVRAAHYGK